MKGTEISRYNLPNPKNYIIFPYRTNGDKAELLNEEEIKSEDLEIWEYLKENEKVLREREKGKFDNEMWYAYSRNQNIAQMSKPKILTQVLAKESTFTIDKNGEYCFVGGGTAGGYGIITRKNIQLEYIVAILNSRLLQWFIQKYASPFRGGYYAYSKATMGIFPIIYDCEVKLSVYTKKMIQITNKIQYVLSSFLDTLSEETGLRKISKKLINLENLDYEGFKHELSRNNIEFKIGDENNQWREYFKSTVAEILKLKSEISKTEHEIDRMVYNLYGLTDDEIKIVEENV